MISKNSKAYIIVLYFVTEKSSLFLISKPIIIIMTSFVTYKNISLYHQLNEIIGIFLRMPFFLQFINSNTQINL